MIRLPIAPSLAHNLCSHLQNTSRRRLRLVPMSSTILHASILNVLLNHGFVSSISRGTPSGPDPAGFVGASVSERRLWVEHKFRDEQPVLRSATPISKPSLKVLMQKHELAQFVRSRLGLGEICVVRSLDGKSYREAREFLKRMNDSESVEVVCRVSS